MKALCCDDSVHKSISSPVLDIANAADEKFCDWGNLLMEASICVFPAQSSGYSDEPIGLSESDQIGLDTVIARLLGQGCLVRACKIAAQFNYLSRDISVVQLALALTDVRILISLDPKPVHIDNSSVSLECRLLVH